MQTETVDITDTPQKDIKPPINVNANPPGHDEEVAAAASAVGAIAASASPVGTARVDTTDTAVRLISPSMNRGHPDGEIFETVSGQTIDITGVSPYTTNLILLKPLLTAVSNA